jgi:hypothetical protein
MTKVKEICVGIVVFFAMLAGAIVLFLKFSANRGPKALAQTKKNDEVLQAQITADDTQAATASAAAAADQTKIKQDQSGEGDAAWQTKR